MYAYTEAPIEIPAGGLASFLTSTSGEWADTDDVPETGIAGVEHIADQLAEFGRHEDTYIVHASEGETVIPMEVFKENPRLKATLFSQMREMGIDPQRYVVGDELNSINPVTGQPEFFLKKLWRGIKKVAKTAFKVIIPVVITALLTPILGPAGASAATGYMQAKYYGYDDRDALKQAGIAALTTGIMKGVESKAKPGGTFGEGVKQSITGSKLIGPSTEPSWLAKQFGAQSTAAAGTTTPNLAQTAAQQGQFGSGTQGPATGGTSGVSTTYAARPDTMPVMHQQLPYTPSGTTVAQSGLSPAGQQSMKQAIDAGSLAAQNREIYGLNALDQPITGQVAGTSQLPSTRATWGERATGLFDKNEPLATRMKEGVMPSSYNARDVMEDALINVAGGDVSIKTLDYTTLSNKYAQHLGTMQGTPVTIRNAQIIAAQQASQISPTTFGKWGIPAIAAAGAAGLMAEDEAEEEPPSWWSKYTPADYISAYPQRYTFTPPQFSAKGGPANKPCCAGCASGGPCASKADGGASFPRRDGSISGPGTGTSDDVPAMLSDGEFVMTADAVRGAGNGNRPQGMRKMYEIMRSFEGTV